MSETKACTKCLNEKPLSEFHRKCGSRDGLHSWCRPCYAAYKKGYRSTPAGREASRRADRKRSRTEARRASKRETERRTERTAEKRVAAAVAREKWSRSHPGQFAANRAVRRAVESGRLRKEPCRVCGATEKIHGHHEDYAKPLDVIWLCPLHHKARHLELIETTSEPPA